MSLSFATIDRNKKERLFCGISVCSSKNGAYGVPALNRNRLPLDAILIDLIACLLS